MPKRTTKWGRWAGWLQSLYSTFHTVSHSRGCLSSHSSQIIQDKIGRASMVMTRYSDEGHRKQGKQSPRRELLIVRWPGRLLSMGTKMPQSAYASNACTNTLITCNIRCVSIQITGTKGAEAIYRRSRLSRSVGCIQCKQCLCKSNCKDRQQLRISSEQVQWNRSRSDKPRRRCQILLAFVPHISAWCQRICRTGQKSLC